MRSSFREAQSILLMMGLDFFLIKNVMYLKDLSFPKSYVMIINTIIINKISAILEKNMTIIHSRALYFRETNDSKCYNLISNSIQM